MKIPKHKVRFVSRKLKKALKNYPCKKTKLGRYVINVLDSSYDVYEGYDCYSYHIEYEHPSGDFFHHLVSDENPVWTYDELWAERHGLLDSEFEDVESFFNNINIEF